MKKALIIIITLILCTFLCVELFAQSETDVAAQCRAIDTYFTLLEKFGSEYPEHYGGAYYSQELKTLVVQSTLPPNDAKNVYSDYINTDGLIFEQVRYSYNELKKCFNILQEKLFSEEYRRFRVCGLWISVMENGIGVETGLDSGDELMEEIRKLTDIENIFIETGAIMIPMTENEPKECLVGEVE